VTPPRRALARFEREEKAIAALSHPSIFAIYDLGQAGGRHYAVMELLEGRTLRDLLRDGSLSSKKSIEYARQIAEGLAAAHAKGIVHGVEARCRRTPASPLAAIGVAVQRRSRRHSRFQIPAKAPRTSAIVSTGPPAPTRSRRTPK
jgi:aminoglycoside phosphotransferase (APT) family kinase protein